MIEGDLADVELLAAAGAARGPFGLVSLLMLAKRRGMFQLLVRLGEDVNQVVWFSYNGNDRSWSALLAAV